MYHILSESFNSSLWFKSLHKIQAQFIFVHIKTVAKAEQQQTPP